MMFYKDTGLQDSPIGKISKDWEIQELSDFVEIETGKRAKGGGLSEGTVASIGGEHIDRHGNILWIDMKYIPEDLYGLLKQGRVRLEDILLVKDGATTGKVAIAEYLKYERVAVNEHVFLIRSKTERLSNRFLFHFLFSKFGQRQIRTRFHGLIGGIMRSDLETVLVPIPSIVEQRAVVGVLGVVDSAIELVDRVIWKTERLKKGLMQMLLTKGIGHTEYKDTPIGKIPKEWDVLPCSELCREITVGIVVTPAKYYTSSGIPCLRSFNIQENEINPRDLVYISPEANMLHKKSILHTGDIVAVRTGQPGTASVVPPAFDGANCVDLIIFRPNDKIRSDFMSCFLNSPVAKRQITAGQTGSVQQHFNIGMTQKLKISIPPLHEQAKIASTVYLAHKKLKLALEEKTRLQRVKRGLMDLLLTGKIRIKVS